MNENVIEPLDEKGLWRSREVTYWGGRWDQIRSQIPQFETAELRVGPDMPANPYLRSVIRLPRNKIEQPMPVGTVSNSYALAQHADVAAKCFDGVREAGIETTGLRCELGLSALGEWMNLRIYFPDEYSHTPKDGERLALRLECFNSVDGSSRLVILLGWLRFVCSNGLIIGETRAELRDVHNKNLTLEKIPKTVGTGLQKVEQDLDRLRRWESLPVELSQIQRWADGPLSKVWGKKAACRVYHICATGFDVEITDPFVGGNATAKPTKQTEKTMGSPSRAETLLEVLHALFWVASRRNSAEEKVEWQSNIPVLIGRLAADG